MILCGGTLASILTSRQFFHPLSPGDVRYSTSLPRYASIIVHLSQSDKVYRNDPLEGSLAHSLSDSLLYRHSLIGPLLG